MIKSAISACDDDRLSYTRVVARARSRRTDRRHVQQELFKNGGKRRGAGRKPKGARAGSPHKERPEVGPRQGLHVVLRVVPAVGSLRRRELYKAMRDATVTAAIRERIRIVHISLQHTHVHLLVEAEDKRALARGMQGFQISAARHINTLLGDGRYRRRRGPVFADRYHLEVITSPTQARHTLSYVVINRPVVPGATAGVASGGSGAVHRLAVARCASARRVWIGATRGVYAASERDPRGFALVPARTRLLVSVLIADTWSRAERGPRHTLC